MRQTGDTPAWASTKAASRGARTPAALLRLLAGTWPGGLALGEGGHPAGMDGLLGEVPQVCGVLLRGRQMTALDPRGFRHTERTHRYQVPPSAERPVLRSRHP